MTGNLYQKWKLIKNLGKRDIIHQERYKNYLKKYEGMICPECRSEDPLTVTHTEGYYANTDDLVSNVLLVCDRCKWTKLEQKPYSQCF